uniref:Retropepsin-like protein n=1 Tax=Phaseolus vulgaris TaxID=3885 RepID=I7AYD2_PHAVU|nr:retropepsin-like protein [Phaseolus vulgaris]
MCIQYPDGQCELKSGLIHLLPKFHGLAGEDPHKHLKKFHTMCTTMRPAGVTEKHIKLKAFPSSLQDAAKDWLYYLPAGSVTNWERLKRVFLEKFFPASRATSIRKEICGIRQQDRESLYEYWEIFKRLCTSCPYHQINEQLLIQYFDEGLIPINRQMIDAASGGALVDKTPVAARQVIEIMASNNQQFHTRSNSAAPVRGVHEMTTNYVADHAQMKAQLDDLTSMTKQLTMPQMVARVCGICIANHATDACPTLQEVEGGNNVECPQAYAANIFNSGRQSTNFPFNNRLSNPPQQPFNHDLSTNKYNPGWKNHPNLRWEKGGSSLEDVIKHMAEVNTQFQQRTSEIVQRTDERVQRIEVSIHNLENQIGQLVTRMNEMNSKGSDKLPSQTAINPHNVNSITLRSENDNQRRINTRNKDMDVPPRPSHEVDIQGGNASLDRPSIPLPFPQRVVQTSRKMEKTDKEILETFRKVEVNIPLLDVIKQIPRYAKFFKDLCTHKRRLKGNEKVNMGRNVSALIAKPAAAIPEKCKDPGTFTIPCIIGNNLFENAMLDLGASINVMPLSVFSSLSLGPLKPTGVVIQLANRSTVQPAGLIEDILIQVNKLVFPTDFYILDMGGEDSNSSATTMILGRPFLRTARTKIDVHTGTLTMEFGDNLFQFNILDVVKHPVEDHSMYHLDILDDIADDNVLDFLGDCNFSDSIDWTYAEIDEFISFDVLDYSNPNEL